MKRIMCLLAFIFFGMSAFSQSKTAEDYYVSAFNEMSDMLERKDAQKYLQQNSSQK